jgi:TfoX/Sxy family transcriptional regulator of competence genes
MATDQKTIDLIMQQIQAAENVRGRKMFGEYTIYCDDKVVGCICDNKLFIKMTSGNTSVVRSTVTGQPYPGAKPQYMVDKKDWDDPSYLSLLVRVTANDLPLPTPKKKKVS